jgi:hypothetical protein
MARAKPLTDLQLILLSHAAKTDAGRVYPLPVSVTDDERTRGELNALLKRKLVTEAELPQPARGGRNDGERGRGLVLTDAGRAALGLGEGGEAQQPAMAATNDLDTEDSSGLAPVPARTGSKRDLTLGLLSRPEGATLAVITAATGWLPHSARAVLTGLRKQGHVLVKGKRGEVTVYTIADAGGSARAAAGADTMVEAGA